jgi:hypothetical protein
MRVISIRSTIEGLRVHVTFRSRQAPTLGPDGQACTNWNLVYAIRTTRAGTLKLLHSDDVVYSAC